MPLCTATRAATRSATSRKPSVCACPLCGARPGSGQRCAGNRGRGTDWRVRPHGRGVARQGLGDRPLGDDGARPRSCRSRRFLRVSSRPHRRFEARIGRGTIGNIRRLGHRHHRRARARAHRTGKPIVYTSADSVFQIAAHEEVVPVRSSIASARSPSSWQASAWASAASSRDRSSGVPGDFKRTANRRDFALTPFAPTLLDRLKDAGHDRPSRSARSRICSPVAASRAPCTRRATTTGWTKSRLRCRRREAGLIFANLVDFDTQYGHRNDPAGYAANLERFDARLATFLPRLTTSRSADRHRGSRQRSDDAEHRSLARARAGVRRSALRCARNVDLGVRAHASPISVRRSPSSSASGRSRTARSFLDEILREPVGIHEAAALGFQLAFKRLTADS